MKNEENGKSPVIEEERETEILDTSPLATIERSAHREQVETARRFPRSLRNFQADCKEMACLNQKVAAECTYTIPRDGKFIVGPSARMAEIVMTAWGNCRAGARVIGEEGDFVVAQGVFQDMQRNTAISYDVRRRIVNKNGDRFSADMIGVTSNAACSIALRNAVFKGVPKAYWNDVWEEAKRTATGDAKSLEQGRQAALAAFKKIEVETAQLCEHLGVTGIADIGIDELIVLQGLLTSIQEGEITVKSTFPSIQEPKRKGAKAPAAETTAAAAPADSTGNGNGKSEEVPLINKTQVGIVVGVAKKKGMNEEALLQWLFANFQIDGGPAKIPAARLDEILNAMGSKM